MIFETLLILSHWINFGQALQPYLSTDIDYATSPIDFKTLIAIEFQIVEKMLQISEECSQCQEYLDDFESSLLRDLDLNIEGFEKLHDRSIFDINAVGDDASKHPFKIFRTIRRFVKLLPKVINVTSEPGLLDKIQELKSSNKYPKDADLENSILNILRLNQIFKLPFPDFIKGKVGRISTKCGLTSEHLVEIGKVASMNNYYSQAVDAFSAALWNGVKRMNEGHQNERFAFKHAFQDTVGKLSLTDTLEHLQQAIKSHDDKLRGSIDIEDIQTASGPLLFNDLLHNLSHPNFKSRTPVKLNTLIVPTENTTENSKIDVIKFAFTFEELCRGGKGLKSKSSLKCYLSSKTHPQFVISPLKIEVHHEDPILLQFHDVIGEREMQNYQEEVKNELRDSRTVRGVDETMGVVSRHRTSSNAWIEDLLIPRFSVLLHKFGRMLNVSTGKGTGSENIQIAAYNPGAHYVPHTDAVFEEEVLKMLDPSEFLRGDRIITFMIYLSDVEDGGATAFPFLNTAVQPKKGSAVMWYNLNTDGSIDRRTLHGGCSVLYGVKWSNYQIIMLFRSYKGNLK